MSTATQATPQQAADTQIATVAAPRLPYHPGIGKQFGLDSTVWRALVESTFPTAKTTGAVILALAYCKARGLDPFKRVVHIVPIWDKETKCYVETVWPGIAEYRTTAFRTKQYAGHEPTAFGPMIQQSWGGDDGGATVAFPEWAQMTVYRLIDGERYPFPGPKVYWLETYATRGRTDLPNTMWADRPIGMLEKCAEAAALRSAFPEELGGEFCAEEVGGRMFHGRPSIEAASFPAPSRADDLAARLTRPAAPASPSTDPHEATAQAVATEVAAGPAGTTPTVADSDALAKSEMQAADYQSFADACDERKDLQELGALKARALQDDLLTDSGRTRVITAIAKALDRLTTNAATKAKPTKGQKGMFPTAPHATEG